jgi:hypothetical protein
MTTVRITILIVVFTIMLGLTAMNLTFSNTLGETCGLIHPYIFQTRVSVIEPDTGRDWSSIASLPTSESLLDSYLRIYDANGNLLEQNDDYENRNAGIIDFRVYKPQTIIVEAATFNDASRGNYKLELQDTPADLSQVYQELTLGSSLNDEIKINDHNRYILNLAAEQELSIMINGVDTHGAVLDTYLRIYNQMGQIIAQNDDYLGLNAGLVPFSVNTDSIVIVEVGTFNDSGEGTFSITVEPYDAERQIPTPQATVSNLDIFDGLAIAVDESFTQSIQANMRVRHLLNLQANQVVDILLTGELDTYLRIYDESGKLIAENDDFSELNSGIVGLSFAEDKILNVEVGTYNDAQSGDYQLSINTSPLQIRQGAEIGVDESLSNQIVPALRVRHMLHLAADQLVNILLSSEVDTYLRIFDSSGQLLKENDDFSGINAGIMSFSLSEGGTILIEVSSLGDLSEGQYELRVEESHIEFIDGLVVSLDTPISGDILPNQRIRYSLELSQGQAVVLNMRGQAIQGEPLHGYLRLYDEVGQLIAESYNTEELATIPRFEAYQAMTLIVEVATFDDASEGQYQLSVGEFQIAFATGDEIQIGTTIHHSIAVGERIQHALSLEAGQPVIILLEGDLDTYLRIYDEAGNLLEQNDDLIQLNAGILGFSVNTDSTVIVEVATLGDFSEGDYELFVEPYSLSFIQEYLNIEITNADAIEVNTSITGEIHSNQRMYHSLTLREGQIINISLSGQQADGAFLDTYLRIYGQSGNLLAQNDDFDGLSSAITGFSVAQNAILLVEVATYGDSQAGHYQLQIEANNVKVDDLGSITIGEIVTGVLKPNQRFRYTLDLEADRSISIFLRYDDIQAGLGLAQLSSYFHNSADDWVSCLEYYGYVVESAYVINTDGIGQFVYGSKLEQLCDFQAGECQMNAQVQLTSFGQFLFYVILPGFAIILPIIVVFMLKGDWEALWFVSLMLVASYLLTSSLLYVHLGTVSGIVALSEFAYGIFGGTATGSAIAFMTKVLDNFSIDRSEDRDEQTRAILKIIEEKLRDSIED